MRLSRNAGHAQGASQSTVKPTAGHQNGLSAIGAYIDALGNPAGAAFHAVMVTAIR